MKPKFKTGQNAIIQRPFPALPNMGWGYIPNLSIVRIAQVLPEKEDVWYRVECIDGTIRHINEFFLEDAQLDILQA